MTPLPHFADLLGTLLERPFSKLSPKLFITDHGVMDRHAETEDGTAASKLEVSCSSLEIKADRFSDVDRPLHIPSPWLTGIGTMPYSSLLVQKHSKQGLNLHLVSPRLEPPCSLCATRQPKLGEVALVSSPGGGLGSC